MKRYCKIILLLIAFTLSGCFLPACSSLAPKGNCFGPPTQAQQDAHASFTSKLSLP